MDLILVRFPAFFSTLYILFIKVLVGFFEIDFRRVKRATVYRIPERRPAQPHVIAENAKNLAKAFFFKFGIDLFNKSSKGDLERFENQEYNQHKCPRCYANDAEVMLKPCLHGGICQICAKEILSSRNLDQRICPFCSKEIKQFVILKSVYEAVKKVDQRDLEKSSHSIHLRNPRDYNRDMEIQGENLGRSENRRKYERNRDEGVRERREVYFDDSDERKDRDRGRDLEYRSNRHGRNSRRGNRRDVESVY